MGSSTPQSRRTNGTSSRWPTILSAIAGAWLFASAFAWPGNFAQIANAWICGGLVVVISGIGVYAPQARYLNALLAMWIVISPFTLPSHGAAIAWNTIFMGLVVFVASLVPLERAPRARTT
jgi:hypothetical protein